MSNWKSIRKKGIGRANHLSVVIIVYIKIASLSSCMVVNPDSSRRFNLEYPVNGIRIACVGDSNTQGSTAGDFREYSYPAQLSKMLGDKYIVENFGVNGATAIIENGKPMSKMNAYRYSLEFKPEIVIIMLGSNDSKTHIWNRESYSTDYKNLIKTYLDMPNPPRVLAVLPLPAYSKFFRVQGDIIQNEVIPEIIAICDDLDIEYIDLNDAYKGRYKFDKLHLDKEGYQEVAQIIFESIDWED